MKIDIYNSATSGNKYLSVPAGTKLESLSLAEGTDPDLLTLSPFRTRIEFDPKRPRVAIDEADIKAQIALRGYAIHDSKVTLTVGPK
jgi:hypothetical protein